MMISFVKSLMFWSDYVLLVSLREDKLIGIDITTGEKNPDDSPGVNIPATGELLPKEARILAEVIKLAANIADDKLSGAEIQLTIANINLGFADD